MAKRGPEEQLTKDDYNSDGEGGGDEPGEREAALKPVEGRQIRGLPKRKGLGSAAPSAPAPSSTPSFSFGSAAAPAPAPAASTSNPFSFGASSATPAAPKDKPAFTFGAPSASNGTGFSLGAAPDATSGASTSDPKPATASPFGGFSFGAKAADKPDPAPPSSGFSFAKPAAEAPKPDTSAKPAFGGFSFSAKASDAPTPKDAPAAETDAPKADAPKAFTGFSFGKAATAPSAESASNRPAPSIAGPAASSHRHASLPGPSLPTPPSNAEVTYYTALRGLNSSFLSFLSQQLNGNEFLDLMTVLPSLLTQYESHLSQAAGKAGWQPPPQSVEESTQATKAAPKPAAPAAPAPLTAVSTETAKSVTPTSAPAAMATKQPSSVNKIVEDVLGEDDDMTGSSTKEAKEAEAPKFSFGSGSKSSGLFSFAPSGALHPTTPASKTFTPSASTTSPSEPPPKLGKFGPDGTTPQLSFGGAKPATSTATPSASQGFSFGASSSPSTGFAFGAADKGDKAGPSAPSGGAFGSSTSKPFAFGTSTSATPFSFGGTPDASAPASGAASGIATPAEPTPEAGEPSKDLSTGAGAGEEDEDTVLEQRGKLYAIQDGKFEVVGLGQFKLKRGKEDGKRRLLMRTEGGGNIILNMAVAKSFSATQRDNGVMFAGNDVKGEARSFMLRVKTKDMAQQVVSTLNDEAGQIA